MVGLESNVESPLSQLAGSIASESRPGDAMRQANSEITVCKRKRWVPRKVRRMEILTVL